MSLNLTQDDLPARVHYDTSDGDHGHSVIVFVYSDGKVLTASALVLNPADWTNIEITKNCKCEYGSPPWAGKTLEELSDYYRERSHGGMGLGKFVEDVSVMIARDVEEGKKRRDAEVMKTYMPPTPKSVTKITPEDDVPMSEVLGVAEEGND
jgi:hypothetical protein